MDGESNDKEPRIDDANTSARILNELCTLIFELRGLLNNLQFLCVPLRVPLRSLRLDFCCNSHDNKKLNRKERKGLAKERKE